MSTPSWVQAPVSPSLHPRLAVSVLLINHLSKSLTCFLNLCLENSDFHIMTMSVLTVFIAGNLENKVLTADEFLVFSAFRVIKSFAFPIHMVKDFAFQDVKIRIPVYLGQGGGPQRRGEAGPSLSLGRSVLGPWHSRGPAAPARGMWALVPTWSHICVTGKVGCPRSGLCVNTEH